jgi:hypothetical protein
MTRTIGGLAAQYKFVRIKARRDRFCDGCLDIIEQGVDYFRKAGTDYHGKAYCYKCMVKRNQS